jgi:proteic killer suppression protein
MDVRFADPDLERLELDQQFNAGFAWPIVRAFRKRMQLIRAARDERDFYAMKSLRYEKLSGNRAHQKSMRLNDQWRLVVEIDDLNEITVVVLVEIVDYH